MTENNRERERNREKEIMREKKNQIEKERKRRIFTFLCSLRNQFLPYSTSELVHDKASKMASAPSEDSDSLVIRPVWSESSLSAWRNLGPLASHWAHSEDWSAWADAQADLSLRWAHQPLCRFCHALAQLSPPWNHLTSKWHQNLANQNSLPVNG